MLALAARMNLEDDLVPRALAAARRWAAGSAAEA
jgi:hypothetical protein